MRNILTLILTLVLAVIALACGSSFSGGGETPTEAYKQFYAAVKSKDSDAIKNHMSKQSLTFVEFAAKRQGIPIEKVLENGLTATTFADTLPELRDERISGDSGSVEVWNGKNSRWEDLPFVKEDGVWKLAIGDLMGGTFKSPGKGQDMREKEAANLMKSNVAPESSPANVNTASVTADDPTGAKPSRTAPANQNK